MAKVKQVLNAVSVEEAKQKRSAIAIGRSTPLLVGNGVLRYAILPAARDGTYCIECGNAILDVAADDLEALRAA